VYSEYARLYSEYTRIVLLKRQDTQNTLVSYSTRFVGNECILGVEYTRIVLLKRHVKERWGAGVEYHFQEI